MKDVLDEETGEWDQQIMPNATDFEFKPRIDRRGHAFPGIMQYNQFVKRAFELYPIVAKIKPAHFTMKGSEKEVYDYYEKCIYPKSVYAWRGWVYWGVGIEDEHAVLSPVFDFGHVTVAHGVMNLATGVQYSEGDIVKLNLHRQVPRMGETVEMREIEWKILAVFFGPAKGGNRHEFEPFLLVFNPLISRYDFTYKEVEVGGKIRMEKQEGLPDVPKLEFPRWKFVPMHRVKFLVNKKTRVLDKKERNIRRVALKGIENDPEDPDPPDLTKKTRKRKEEKPTKVENSKQKKKKKAREESSDTESEDEAHTRKMRPKAVVVKTDALMLKINRLEREKQELVKASETFKKVAEREAAKGKDLQAEMKSEAARVQASFIQCHGVRDQVQSPRWKGEENQGLQRLRSHGTSCTLYS